jgi:hypothetical protein
MKKLIVIGVVTLLVASFMAAGLAFAQSQDPPATPAPGTYCLQGRMGSTATGPMHDAMHDAIAEALGLTREALDERMAAGEMPWLIAQDQGLSWDEFQAIMAEARSAAIEQAVADGLLTEAQAQQMLQNHGRGGMRMGHRGGGMGMSQNGQCLAGIAADGQYPGMGMRGGMRWGGNQN